MQCDVVLSQVQSDTDFNSFNFKTALLFSELFSEL